jgi:hypothetical protein
MTPLTIATLDHQLQIKIQKSQTRTNPQSFPCITSLFKYHIAAPAFSQQTLYNQRLCWQPAQSPLYVFANARRIPKICSCAFAEAKSYSSSAVLPPTPHRAFGITWLQKSLTAFTGPISAKFVCGLQALRREVFFFVCPWLL